MPPRHFDLEPVTSSSVALAALASVPVFFVICITALVIVERLEKIGSTAERYEPAVPCATTVCER